MSDQQREFQDVAASLLTHKALLGALFTLLQERGLLSADDINTLFDEALTTLEKAEAESPTLIGRARRVLERTSRNLARTPISTK